MQTESLAGERTYSLVDICKMFGFTARQIHDFRAKGALQPPDGTGRGARYADGHIQRLGAIKPLLESGISVARIAARYSLAPVIPRLDDLPTAVTSERWDRVRIGPDLEISLLVGGNLERLRAQLISHLGSEAKRLLALHASDRVAGRGGQRSHRQDTDLAPGIRTP